MKIGELGERELIKKIALIVAPDGLEEGTVGIGDDAAVTPLASGQRLVTTTDMLVEGIHFLAGADSAAGLGHKALAVNLSDLAAMGASARYAFVSLALPGSTDVEFVLDFYRGMKETADRYGVRVMGGDTVGSPGPLVIGVTVQGEVRDGGAMLRSGARPGDFLCVTGRLGASAAGLLLLLQNQECPEKERRQALSAHLRPVPRLAEGEFLSATGAVTAAVDLSDGLLKDLFEICEQSGCGALLYEKDIPVHPAALCVATLQGSAPLDLALSGGEDYELLFAVAPERFAGLVRDYAARFQNPLYRIGEITSGDEILMVTRSGKKEKIIFKGFKHF